MKLNDGDYIQIQIVSCEDLEVIVRHLSRSGLDDHVIAEGTELSLAEVRAIIGDPDKARGVEP